MAEALSRYWWAVVLRGIAGILFGVVALVWPGPTVFAGALALVTLIGAYAIVFGNALATLGVRLRRNRPDTQAATDARNRPATA